MGQALYKVQRTKQTKPSTILEFFFWHWEEREEVGESEQD